MELISRRPKKPRVPKLPNSQTFNAAAPGRQIRWVRQWVNYWKTYRYPSRMEDRRVQYRFGKKEQRAAFAKQIWEQMKKINEMQQTGITFRMEILDKIKAKWNEGKLTDDQFWTAWRAATDKLQRQQGIVHQNLVNEFKKLRDLIDQMNR